MRMLTGNTLVLFCLIFMFLSNFLIKAQPQYPFYRCHNDSTYTPNSAYDRNLGDALNRLLNVNSRFGYFNSTVGQGIDTVNAIGLCRGDTVYILCQNCLRDAIYRLRQTCVNETEAVIYNEYCLVKYSNDSIIGNNDMRRDYKPLTNADPFSDKNESNDLLQPFMSKLRGEAAAGGSSLKFAMDNTPGPGNRTLYGLTQCIPSLSEVQCNDCLDYAINQMSVCCDGRVGVVILMARCNVRYEIYDFSISAPTLTTPPSTTRGASPPGTFIVSLNVL